VGKICLISSVWHPRKGRRSFMRKEIIYIYIL